MQRWIAISLLLLFSSTLLVPSTAALLPDAAHACCRRSSAHKGDCCKRRKLLEPSPGFREAVQSCPCKTHATAPTSPGQIGSESSYALRLPSRLIPSLTAFHFCHFFQIANSERGPPEVVRVSA